ncbi:phytoene desaturase family protein [Alistipes sp.]|uniref:phytoene desaturase family protein n=1 Tax=Alistipes sp. TaxID=1872444 RepID=UPI003AF0FE39
MRTAVIGAGIGGLAAAIRRAAAGDEVTVWERNDVPGGKLSELRTGPWRFDTGPSLFTLPGLVAELFDLCGERMEEHLPLRRLDASCRYFFPDGSAFTCYNDPEKLSRELARAGIGGGEAVARRLDDARQAYELSAPVFLFSDFHRLANFRTPPYRRIASQLGRLDLLRTMHGANRRDFRDRRLVQLFDRYATYNGSSPYRAPATLNMIAHLEHNLGASFPERGIYAIAEELYRLALRQGVRFRFGTPVERIVTERGRAVGLTAAGETCRFDRIVSDVDVCYLSERLLAGHPLRGRLRRAEPSSSALIFYWGVEGRYPQLGLHNVLFADDYRTEFRRLFRDRTIADDATVYLFVSSKVVVGDAPDGCENWYAMVNAPADCGQDWDALAARVREQTVRKISRQLQTDLAGKIAAERVCTPRDIEARTMSACGALYGASSNGRLAAFLRHPNRLSMFENLYFVGGSVHPGGGIPLCLASAKIVCDEIAAGR